MALDLLPNVFDGTTQSDTAATMYEIQTDSVKYS